MKRMSINTTYDIGVYFVSVLVFQHFNYFYFSVYSALVTITK